MNNKKKLIIIIFLIIIICIAIFVYFRLSKNNKDENTNNNTNIDELNIVENINYNSNFANTTDNEEITNSNNDENSDFLMPIEDVFHFTGQETSVSGEIKRGTININDSVQIVGLNNEVRTTVVTEIRKFQEELNTATTGDRVSIFLKDVNKEEIQIGQVLAKPNTISAKTKFTAEVHMITEEEGGKDDPLYNGSTIQCYFGVIDIPGKIILPDNINVINPGDTVNITIELSSPVSMEEGMEFRVRENGQILGYGKVIQ